MVCVVRVGVGRDLGRSLVRSLPLHKVFPGFLVKPMRYVLSLEILIYENMCIMFSFNKESLYNLKSIKNIYSNNGAEKCELSFLFFLVNGR